MITAIILAAGRSRRMGQPKMLLPWGDTTVLGKVIDTFRAVEVDDILVVTGGDRGQVEATLTQYAVRIIYNREYASDEMLSSIQIGLKNLSAEAALIALGDQPQVRERSVRLIIETYHKSGASIVVPSFQMRRGHPWLVARPLWDEILEMRSPESPRDFLNRHAEEIHYVAVEDDSILQDLDTPDDYLKSRP